MFWWTILQIYLYCQPCSSNLWIYCPVQHASGIRVWQFSIYRLNTLPKNQQVFILFILGLTEVKFQKSVPMVTYLACFIVCNFEFEEKLTNIHQTKFRVYATPEQKHRVKYSLDLGANITDFFTDYYNISYPLPKQDMIAIPDFVSGAMEHWGLITYRWKSQWYA